MNNKDRLTILLVEDDPMDVMAIQRVLAKSEIPTHLMVVGDGAEALEYLRGQHEQALESPDVLLCDVHMPRMDGVAFLNELIRDPQLSSDDVWLMTFDGMPPPSASLQTDHVAGILSKADIANQLHDLLSKYG